MVISNYPKILKILYLLLSVFIALILNLTYYFFDVRSKNFEPVVPKADAIVVLGAAVWPGGKASPILSDRLVRAANLYKMQTAPKIICTGGIGKNPPSEAQVSKDFLINQGIPEKNILYEDISTSTGEQAIEIKRICEKENFKSIAIVTSFFHEKRAIKIFELAGFPGVIYDARCIHNRTQDSKDSNKWCIREAFFLVKLTWWYWLIEGLFLGFLAVKKLSPKKA